MTSSPSAVAIGKKQFTALLASIMALGALGIDLMLPVFDDIRSHFGLAPDATGVTSVNGKDCGGGGEPPPPCDLGQAGDPCTVDDTLRFAFDPLCFCSIISSQRAFSATPLRVFWSRRVIVP